MDTSRTGFGVPKEKSIDQIIKEAYGLTAKQMEKRMEMAEEAAKSDAFSEENDIPEPPENEYRIILAKMAARGITPRVMADYDEESLKVLQKEDFLDSKDLPHQKEKAFEEHKGSEIREYIGSKGKLLKKKLEIAGIAAACALLAVGVVVAPKIDAIAKKRYKYETRIEGGEKGRVVWNNQENYIVEEGNLEKAYSKIKDKLDIDVLKLNYIPSGMSVSNVDINDDYAKIEFMYEGNHIYFFEISYFVGNSGARFSDRKESIIIYNPWIDKDILIQKNKVKKNIIEYSTCFVVENVFYSLEGIMEEKEFIRTVENLMLDKNE